MEQVEKKIPCNYKFNLPSIIDYVDYGGKILVVAREEANWIVLDNDKQLNFFKLLRLNSLDKAISLSDASDEDKEWVVTQLVARHFEDRVKQQEIIPVAQIYLTNNCNMKCPHCYMMAGKAYDNELTTNEITRVLKAYKENGGVDVKLTGGEITLRDDLIEIVKYGHSIGLSIELLTNGTLWTDELIDTITDYVSLVQISIDGYSEEENAKIRGPHNFNKALLTVDKFAKKNVRTRVAITAYYTPDLHSKTQLYSDFASKLKDKYKDYDVEVVIATGLLPGRYGNLNDKESEDYFRIMSEVNSRYMCCDNFENHGFIARHKSGYILNNCSYGFLSIAANGDVFMCPVVTVMKPVANVRTHSLKEIIEISNHAHNLSFTNNLQPCNNCELKYICGGDCRIRYFEELKFPNIIDIKGNVSRTCDNKTKNKFYDLMLRTNEDIFH